MSRFSALLAELAPKGVEFRTLADLGSISRGKRFVKSDLVESGVPCIHYGEIYTKYGVSATQAFSFLAPAHAERLRKAQPGDVIVASAGETVEDIGKALAWLGDEAVVIHDACFAFRSPLDPKYVVYFFQTDDFHFQIRRNISTSKVSSISPERLGRARIPVPPLEVQREVVRMLDHWVDLDKQLRLERDARGRQYAYYMHRLLDLSRDEGSGWSSLGDVASVGAGKAPRAGMVYEVGPFAYVNAGTTESGRALESNTHGAVVTIPSRGQGGVGVVGYQAKAFWCGPLCYRIVSSRSDLSTRFLYYYLKSIQPTIRGLQQTGGTPALNRKELIRVKVPVPPLHEQERIVGILDKFDTLVNDLSAGLPAELNARRKQFEYYRDRLLTFPEAT
jgi:type I restriction enzyme S subunit